MKKDFNEQLESIGEVGNVEGVKSSVIRVSGLPGAFGKGCTGADLGWVFC
jgi:hypothetical protein